MAPRWRPWSRRIEGLQKYILCQAVQGELVASPVSYTIPVLNAPRQPEESSLRLKSLLFVGNGE